MLGGLNHERTVRILREYTRNLEFADPLLRLDLPATLRLRPLLGLAADVGPVAGPPAARCRSAVRLRAPGQSEPRAGARKAARDCDVVVATYDELTGFGLEDLAGKTLVTLGDLRRAARRARPGAASTWCSTRRRSPSHVTVTSARARGDDASPSSGAGALTDDDLLDMIVAAGLEPRVLYPNGPRRKSRFAFVIHPLSPAVLHQGRAAAHDLARSRPRR